MEAEFLNKPNEARFILFLKTNTIWVLYSFWEGETDHVVSFDFIHIVLAAY